MLLPLLAFLSVGSISPSPARADFETLNIESLELLTDTSVAIVVVERIDDGLGFTVPTAAQSGGGDHENVFANGLV